MSALHPPTLEQLKQRLDRALEARLPDLDPLAASRIKTLHATLAGALFSLYAFALKIEDQLFPDTADEEHLIRAGAWRGYSLRLGTFARGAVRFEVPAGVGVSLPQNTVLTLEGTSIRFQTETSAQENNGELLVNVRSEKEGEEGNVAQGQRFLLLAPIVYATESGTGLLQEGVATADFSGGRATESMESLRQRVLRQAPLTPDRFGRKGDFAHWAMQASDRITAAWEFPNIDQAGTLQISIALAGEDHSASNFPPTGLVKQASDFVQTQAPAFLGEGKRPDGSPTPSGFRIVALAPLRFALRLQITPDTPTIRTALLQSLQAKAQSTAPGHSLSRVQIERILLALPSLENYQTLEHLNPPSNTSDLGTLAGEPLQDIQVPMDRALHLTGIDFLEGEG